MKGGNTRWPAVAPTGKVILRNNEAIEAAALQLAANGLAFALRGIGANADTIEGAHIADHRLVDRRLRAGENGGVLTLDLRHHRFRIVLRPHGGQLHPEAAFGLGDDG